jgi:hypothetical protein
VIESSSNVTRAGELINRLSADTTVISKTLTGNLVNGLRGIVEGIGGTAVSIMWKLYWRSNGSSVAHAMRLQKNHWISNIISNRSYIFDKIEAY